ncbi:Na+/H+ antiporter NhaA, partial [Francisella tularensis subsp. holarctica]|uniref:Na+/H+ antiporter NhaA n=1 Tax=Francisella tularensis TaxID=263 RepID=UPI002381A646
NFMEDSLHPWIIYFILPVFAFAKAGISFSGISFSILFEPITLGLIWGLFVGKQLGIFSILAVFKKLKWVKLGEAFSHL